MTLAQLFLLVDSDPAVKKERAKRGNPLDLLAMSKTPLAAGGA